MKIIDCHVHPRPSVDYAGEFERFIRHMRNHGIGAAVASDLGDGWKAYPDAETVSQANARLQKMCGKYSGEVFYLVYINPQLENWREELLRHENSACGVKLWISLRSMSDKSDLANSVKVIQAAAERNLPVLIHCFEQTGGAAAGSVGIDEMIYFAQKVSASTLIAAHSNGNWRKLIDKADRVPENIFFDVSGCYPERTMVRRLVDRFGSERILYGSDAPGRGFASQLYKVFSAGLAEFELNNILYENSRRIFHLPDLQYDPAKKLPRYLLPANNEDNFCFAGKSVYWDHTVSAGELSALGAKHCVTKLYAASLSAIKCKDFYTANLRWLQETLPYKNIQPLAVVDLPDKEQTLRQLKNLSGFAGVWVSPYLHNWRLGDRSFEWFWLECLDQQIKVWINCALSDDRFRHENLQTSVVLNDEIMAFAGFAPPNKYVLQGTANLADLSVKLPEYFNLEYSRLSDGEYSAEEFFSGKTTCGCAGRLCRGSEYPFREFDEVDTVLNGDI